LGQFVDVDRTPALATLTPTPGRNVAVVGGEEARAVIDAAAVSLAARLTGDGLLQERLIVAPLAGPPPKLPEPYQLVDDFPQFITGFADDVVLRRVAANSRQPAIYLAIWGVDLAYSRLDKDGMTALKTVLHHGPQVGVHVIGWWYSLTRLKTLLASGASADDIGVIVGLDVGSSEFSQFVGVPGVRWAPRPHRALFFDRLRSRRPELMAVPTCTS
jgi:hypothetical protein